MGKYNALYTKMKTTALADWYKKRGDDVLKDIGKGKFDLTQATMIVIAAKVAHNVDEAGFEEFMDTGEVPPIKLSAAEMAVLQGGGGKKNKKQDDAYAEFLTPSAQEPKPVKATISVKPVSYDKSGYEPLQVGGNKKKNNKY